MNREEIAVRTAPSGPDKKTTSPSFEAVPSMQATIGTSAKSRLEITFSGEVETSKNSRMFVRALVDGKPARPSDVVFARGGYTGTRTFTFVTENLTPGTHQVEIQWHADPGAAAFIGDRSLSLLATTDKSTRARMALKAAPSGPDKSTTSTGWTYVPDMYQTIETKGTANLDIRLSGEVETSADSRMFVRALVDGQPANPTDVVFARGGYGGTNSFSFTREKLPAGLHSVQIQWHADPGGTALIGDRTLAVFASKDKAKRVGLKLTAAPSGPDKETTSTGFVPVPHMFSKFSCDGHSDLQITFSAEVETAAGKRMFARALVDGQPADPSDVVFARGGFTGTHAFTFTKEDVHKGSHVVEIQWHTDPGGKAFVGDRTLTISHLPRQFPNLSQPILGLKPKLGRQKVLTILWDPHRKTHPAPPRDAIEKLLYGPKPSVRDYFLEVSNGAFTIEDAGILGWDKSGKLGWFDADYEASLYWRGAKYHPDKWKGTKHYWVDKNGQFGTKGKAYYLDDKGFISGHVHKWAEAIRKAEHYGFNFSTHDRSHDKMLSTDELTILIVIPQDSPFGTQRGVVGKQVPKIEPLIVDGVRVNTMVEAYIGSPPNLGLVLHELSHILLGAGDMYFGGFQGYAAGPYSLMDQSGNPYHLDPFHKLRYGWLDSEMVGKSGWRKLPAVEKTGKVLILCDPDRSEKEYFIVENRWPGKSYDAKLPYAGLAVWHIIEDKSVFDKLPPPPGVDSSMWSKYGGWARRAIRMIRPIYGPPIDWSLWDGSKAKTGYDLLDKSSSKKKATLKWIDGTPSDFCIRQIPKAGSVMKFYVERK
ncbi:MAG: hypothetical protein GY769_06895 [bacterium]|nr:hypothetical protein [bacterium]